MNIFPLMRTLTLIIEQSFLIAVIDCDSLLGSSKNPITDSSMMINFYDDNNATTASSLRTSHSFLHVFTTQNISSTLERAFRSKRCRKMTPVMSYFVSQRNRPKTLRFLRHHECNPFTNSTLRIRRRTRKVSKKTAYWKKRFKRTTLDNLNNHERGEMAMYFDGTPPIVSFVPTEPVTYGLVEPERVKRNATKIKWPNKRVVSIEGDVIIGGLMMVHERGAGGTLCGPIMPQGGVQALDVMLYTLNVVNEDESHPFTIGAHILDDCDTDTYGLEMALDFIKANLHYMEDVGVNKTECSQTIKPSKPIWGVVGAPSSITSIQVSNLLRLFKIPMISPFSTSPELSNKNKYDYFCRTIPSDEYQAQVIGKIVDRLNWTYVSIIYEESNYGIKGLEELEKVLDGKACIAVKEKVLKDSGVPGEEFYNQVVNKLLSKPKARGVIVFASDQEVAEIMKAVRRRNETELFSWIGSDGWSARKLVYEDNEEVVEGTISVQPQAKPVVGFESYFLEQRPTEKNAYFAEYWETHFKCRLGFVPPTPFNENFTEKCSPLLKLNSSTIEVENQLQFIHQATMGFCEALFDMHRELCGPSRKGVCDEMMNNRTSFLRYVKNVTFTDFSKDKFQFDKNCDGPARYNIIHYKSVSSKNRKWETVGVYENGELNLNMDDLQFRWRNKKIPESVCGRNCRKGEKRKYNNDDKCCWECTPCATDEIVIHETECKKCEEGQLPDLDSSSCVNITKVVKRNKFFQISILSTTIFGFVNVLCTLGLYIYNINSPLVKASSREAQFLILIGATFLHANAGSFLLEPSEFVCSMQSYLSGLGYVLIYGTLFWKSYRLVRIFDLGSQCKNLNSTVFVLLVLGLCCIQKIKSVIWTYFVDPRRVKTFYPNNEKINLCSAFTDFSLGYFIAYIFPFGSIVMCYTRTKKITSNMPKFFDDSPQIFFSIRFTIASWISMLVIHFTTSSILFRQNILALITNFNGILAVFILCYKSLFIILFRPHKNTREYLRKFRFNQTMKMQFMGESQQTRQNLSQSVIHDLGLSENSGESRKNKRDVGIQYNNCNSPSRDQEAHIVCKKILRHAYSLNNSENDYALQSKKNIKSQICDVKLKKMSYESPKTSLGRKGSFLKKHSTSINSSDVSSIEKISSIVQMANGESTGTSNNTETHSSNEEIRKTFVEGASRIEDEESASKNSETNNVINTQRNCTRTQNGRHFH